MAVPYTFGSATTSIPLSQLDSNFATTITLGNTAIQLGNTVTTLNNMTLANVTISSGTSNLAATAITNGTSNVTIASSGGNISMATNGTTAITVDTSQNVGVGTSSPSQKLTVQGPSNAAGILVTDGTNSFFLAAITSAGNYGNGSIAGQAYLRGTSGIGFSSNGGTSTAMSLDSSGNLLVGTTSSTGPNPGFSVYTAGSGNTQAIIGHSTASGSGQAYSAFLYNGTYVGSITQNGTTGVLYNLTSDYRLKNDQQPLTGAKDFIMALQPKKWQWWDGSGEGVGFIAHEFMAVAKYSGTGVKDAVDDEGKPIMQSIQPSSSEVMANLVAHIQNLETRLAALEAA